ncbi:MAG: glycine cleavage system aminomethyltransferase GcvT [Lachnospiraceae bacterium]|nr:glycine cleavage system aminomethyltransferase GcvT [Lachnospiraceae bacterium]
MDNLKRTQLYDVHVEEGATMVDFGGWDMPIQYPSGIVSEHLFTRQHCSLFDVSHMGRLMIEGKDRIAFLQHVVTSNVEAIDYRMAQYCIIPDKDGSAIDDAYLYRFEEDKFLLVVNASNTDKDIAHLTSVIKDYDCKMTNITSEWASIAVQGPESKDMLIRLAGGKQVTEPMKNALNIMELEGHTAWIAKTGYTGEPLGYEVFVKSADAAWLWKRLEELGAKPAGLGARDTLRLEAGMPLYGHEMGADPDGNPMPVFAVSLAKFAVSFSDRKGDYIGRAALEKQSAAFRKILNRDYSLISDLPKSIKCLALVDRGVIRAGMEVYRNGEKTGWVTSGTMVPYFKVEGEGLESVITGESLKRSIGMAYVASDLLEDDEVEVDVRGKRLKAVIVERHLDTMAPPYARPIIYGHTLAETKKSTEEAAVRVLDLLNRAEENHLWRQNRCVNLIPSENTPSKAVRLLSASDPNGRYAEHRKVRSFYEKDIFYYQGTKFIDHVEQLAVDEMRKYFNCTEVETRVVSGQMSNMCAFSALMDFKNRLDRKNTPQRLGYILNNHIIRGGHLSAQPMGALHDYVAVDPVTEKSAVVNFPVLPDNLFKIDVEETKKVIEQYRPEFIIFGKSMVIHKEPVAEIRRFVDDIGLETTIMYDMAHVLGLVGDYFQKPFEEGAEIVTGSTHKTFFGPQRGVVACNYKEGELKYELWKTIESRAFPGSVSNHHLGTQLGLLMAAYEMNTFKDAYQKAVIDNAKAFAKALKKHGLNVLGDPAIDYTETHQVLVDVGYGTGAEIANRLEDNNIIVNYQATPEEEGFTASGALRMGVSEMTRFGFTEKEFDTLAQMMADCILHAKPVGEDVAKLRAGYLQMHYCFDDKAVEDKLEAFAKEICC